MHHQLQRARRCWCRTSKLFFCVFWMVFQAYLQVIVMSKSFWCLLWPNCQITIELTLRWLWGHLELIFIGFSRSIWLSLLSVFLKLFYEELTFQCENQNCKHIWSLRPLSHFEGYFEVIVRSIWACFELIVRSFWGWFERIVMTYWGRIEIWNSYSVNHKSM